MNARVGPFPGGFAAIATLIGGLLLALLTLSINAEPAAAADCTRSLQDRINAAPVRGTVQAEPCVYRGQIRITKPLTLVGQSGSEIRGSNVWKNFTSVHGDFKSGTKLPRFPQEDVSCQRGTSSCSRPEQVFVNGDPQRQVGQKANPGYGEFKVNRQRQVVMGTNPAGKLVEVTVRRHWVTGGQKADGVTIRGFTMKHAANEWRSGAIQSREPTTFAAGRFKWGRHKADGDNWNLVDNELSDAHGAVVSVRSDNATLTNNEISRGGQLGIHNVQDNSLVQGNYVHHNNTEKFCIEPSKCKGFDTNGNGHVADTLTESGGIKIANGQGFVTVKGNEFERNYGNGVWFDGDTHDITISDNEIHHNARRGIFFEISRRAKIFGNAVYENGWRTPSSVDGAGIEIGNSDNAEVFNNVVAWNADGIAVRCSKRSGREDSRCEDTVVHDNVIMQQETSAASDSQPGMALVWTGTGGSRSLYARENGNRGYSNDYFYADGRDKHPNFVWSTKYSSLSAFNATRGEENGRYISPEEQRNKAVSQDVPVNPESR